MGVDSLAASNEVVAIIDGQPLNEIPQDLFIPPDALEVLLDSFSGPLDLLLYLIRRQNIDVLNIPMTKITQQYLHYIALMKQHRLELAADYLLMAALLTEIKSRMLLPQTNASSAEQDEEDPRMDLVRRLQIYERFKTLAAQLDALPRCFRDVFPVVLSTEDVFVETIYPDVSIQALVDAMSHVLRREACKKTYQITRERLSVHERMFIVLDVVKQSSHREFSELLSHDEGRHGLIVTFLAILELSRQTLVRIRQDEPFSLIYLQASPYDGC